MQMYNTSLERFEVQCCSKVFKFEPRQSTEVPDEMVKMIYERTQHKGVFPIYPHMELPEIKVAARKAMLAYLNGALRERIVNYRAMTDEYKLRGVTLDKDPRYDRALRWDKEIRAYLEIEAPLEEELSFLDQETREKLGMDPALKDVPQDIFNRDVIRQENKLSPPETPIEKKRGRRPKFEDVKPEEIGAEA